MAVRIFCHNESRLVDSTYPSDDLAENHASNFLDEIGGAKSPDFTLLVTSIEVRDRAQVHCDKWVEEAGMHFSLYSAAVLPSDVPNLSYPPIASNQRQVMKHKVYSGDVSGVIGEALFSILLTKHFMLPDDAFAHLRADKQTGIYPDFAIYAPTVALRARLNWSGNTRIVTPLPAEAKTANYPKMQSLKPQLEKATRQIRNYWEKLGQRGPSIICAAVRNPTLQSYDLAIIWGT
jgi:hypothetical protein